MNTYDDGQDIRVGDVIRFDGYTDGSGVVLAIDTKSQVKYKYSNGGIYLSSARGMRLIKRAEGPIKAGQRGAPIATYMVSHGVQALKHAMDSYKIYDEWTTFPKEQKEQTTMKKAYKAYVIEQDNDGNQVKMLHETIVFAVTKDKAEQAVVIKATKGGVVDEKTNFVVVANPIVY